MDRVGLKNCYFFNYVVEKLHVGISFGSLEGQSPQSFLSAEETKLT